MILYCNGDSFVSGSELIDHIYVPNHPGYFKEPQLHKNIKINNWFKHKINNPTLDFDVQIALEKEHAFPNKIQLLSGIDVVNDAHGGASMPRICRTSIAKLSDLITTFPKQKIVAVIGTTEMNRFEVPNLWSNMWSDISHVMPRKSKSTKSILKYYAINDTDYHQYVRFYLNIIQLQDFCKLNDIDLYWLRGLPESGVANGPTINEIISVLADDNELVQLVKYAKFNYHFSMEELSTSVENPYCPGGHFTEEVHDIVARKISDLLLVSK